MKKSKLEPMNTILIRMCNKAEELESVTDDGDPKEVEDLTKSERLKLDYLKIGIKPLEMPYRYDMLVGLDKEIGKVKGCDNPLGLYLFGTQGTGKSHLTVCKMKEIVFEKSAFGCRYVKASDLFLEIRATYNNNNPKTEEEVINYYRNLRYLAIDDIGSGCNSEFERNALLQILDGRQRNLKWTISNSNLSNTQLKGYIGLREASRFNVYEQVEFKGADWRSKLK